MYTKKVLISNYPKAEPRLWKAQNEMKTCKAFKTITETFLGCYKGYEKLSNAYRCITEYRSDQKKKLKGRWKVTTIAEI